MPWNKFAPAAVAGLVLPLALAVPVVQGRANQDPTNFVQAERATAARHADRGTALVRAKRAKAKGALLVRIVASNKVRSPAVVVDGPRGYRVRVTETSRLTRLRPGWYRILPRFRAGRDGRTTVRRSHARIRIRAGRTPAVKVTFRWNGARPDGPGAEPTAWEADVIRLTNAARKKTQNCGSEGRFRPAPALRAHRKLTLAARRHAKDMADHNYFDHDSRDGRNVGDRYDRVGYKWSWWGENIAAGQRSPAEVVEAWLDSDGHCANLMARQFTEIGVGFARGGRYGKYWVQDFARPR